MRTAFTLLEAAFSTVLVGGLVVVSLETVGAATVGKHATNTTAAAKLLASSLMAEILGQDYEEPDDTPTFGLEVAEGNVNRLLLDDVDDYQNLSLSPPSYRDGTTIPGYAGWSCTVDVVRVNPNDLTAQSGTDTGVKRIDVHVLRNGVELARLSAVKTGNPESAPLSNAPNPLTLLKRFSL